MTPEREWNLQSHLRPCESNSTSGERVEIEVDGARGSYEVAGDGPSVVLLASPLALAKTYRPTTAALARTFRVYAVELPGSVSGWHLADSWSVVRYAQWVAELLNTLGLDRPVLIGHSHSGSIAVVVAARHAGVVGRLVVADATGTGPHSFMRTFSGGFYDLLLDISLVLRAGHHVVGNLFRHPVNFVRQVADSLSSDVRADIAQVDIPMLVAWGARDHTLPPRNAGVYAEWLPGALVYLSPRGSHDWIITQPDEFAALIMSFAAHCEAVELKRSWPT